MLALAILITGIIGFAAYCYFAYRGFVERAQNLESATGPAPELANQIQNNQLAESSDTAFETAALRAFTGADKVSPRDVQKYYRDYKANEVSADAEYKGLSILTYGAVLQISKDFSDDIYVDLQGGESTYEKVSAYLDPIQYEYNGGTKLPNGTVDHNFGRSDSIQVASSLVKGQMIGIYCVGGGMLVGTPVLKGCVIMPKGLADEIGAEAEKGINHAGR